MIILFLIIQFFFIFYLNKQRLKGKFKLTLNKIALLSSILTYIIIVIFAIYLKFKFKAELEAYDLNKDGFFNDNEINEEQQKAMKNVISDTSRNLAPFTGILFSILYYAILLFIFSLINTINKKYYIHVKQK